MESSEIDLSEFQEENRDDGDGDAGNNIGSGQGEAHPSSAAPEPASENAGGTILPLLMSHIFLVLDFLDS